MIELTIDEALRLGAEAHKLGRFQEADGYYTSILRSFPDHPNANHNMGLLAITVGQPDRSIPFLRKALQKNKNVPQFWLSLVDAYIKLKKYKDARSTIKLALENGLAGSALNILSEKLNNLDHNSVEKLTTSDIQKVVDLYNQRDYPKALEKVSLLLEKHDKSFFLQNICGASNFAMGRYEAAVKNYLTAIKLNPNFADAYNNLGIAKHRMGDLDSAIINYEQAINKKPDFAQAYNNLGGLLIEIKDYVRAITILSQAIKIKKNFTEAYINLGISYKKTLELDRALVCHRKAVEGAPQNIKALHNLGKTYSANGEFQEAINYYDKALKIKPNFETAAWDNALSCLKIGDFDKGWKLWKRRFLHDGLKKGKRNFKTAKFWNGEKNVESIMLWREQGLGDEMLFANYFHLVKGQNRIIEVSPRLKSIFKRSFPNDTVRIEKFDPDTLYSPEEDYQYHMPFGEVGPIFNIGKKVDPKAYLVPDPKLATEWSKIKENQKLTIGLSWRSGFLAEERLKHYTSLNQWARLLGSPKVRVISTQYSNIDDDINSLGSAIRKRLYIPDVDIKNDIESLAAILVNCDLVIGPASATTMLAGSLGRRTIIFAHRDNHYVSGRIKLGEKGKHPWAENGEVHIFDQCNQELVINNIINEIILTKDE